MKVREHRGSLDESMTTVAEIEPTRSALLAHIKTRLHWPVHLSVDDLVLKPGLYDARIDWNTHVLAIRGYGVFGMTDGPLED
jgi:hypothetical protein